MWWKLLIALPLVLSSSLGGSRLNASDAGDHPDASGSSAEILSIDLAPELTPQEIYHRAWQLIKDEYVDQHFNGQSWAHWEHRYDSKMKDLTDAHKCIETMALSLP